MNNALSERILQIETRQEHLRIRKIELNAEFMECTASKLQAETLRHALILIIAFLLTRFPINNPTKK